MVRLYSTYGNFIGDIDCIRMVKKLIRYEKFIDWVKRLVTKEGVTVH